MSSAHKTTSTPTLREDICTKDIMILRGYRDPKAARRYIAKIRALLRAKQRSEPSTAGERAQEKRERLTVDELVSVSAYTRERIKAAQLH